MASPVESEAVPAVIERVVVPEAAPTEVLADGGADGEPPPVFDAAAEASFLAEARERGEPVVAARATVAAVEENTDPKNLPPLADLVKRIPAEVRETLDELFRAKFVSVKRLPAKALAPKA